MTETSPADLAAQTAPPGLTAEEWQAVLRSRAADSAAPRPTVVPTPVNVPPDPAYGTPTDAVITIKADGDIEWVAVDLVGEKILAKVPKMMDGLAMASAAAAAYAMKGKDDIEGMGKATGELYERFAGHIKATVHPDYVDRVMERMMDASDLLDFGHINDMVAALQEVASRRADLPPTSP